MATRHSTTPTPPNKPYRDFPLTPHRSGKWCKKIKGKLHYFGRWADPQGALEEYLQARSDLENGRARTTITEGGLTVKQMVDAFLTAKEQRRDVGDISPRTFKDMWTTGKRIADHFQRHTPVESLGPADFTAYRDKIARRRNAIGVGNEITRVKQFFHWAYNADLIERPVKFGPEFSRPSARTVRMHKGTHGKRVFTREQCHALLDECGVHVRAMVLLGLNAGLSNSDIATLPTDVVNLDTAWIDYRRRKTGTQRRFKLWPETVRALQDSLERRPTPNQGCEQLFFLRPSGAPWGIPDTPSCPISVRIRAALQNAQIYRKGLSFYSCRHTFRTIADQAKDQPAADLIMGHVDSSIRATYREFIDDSRLEAITDHVRHWLFEAEADREVESC